MTNRSNTSAKANPVTRGFRWTKIIAPLSVGHAFSHPAPRHESRHRVQTPRRVRRHAQCKPTRSGFCQDNAPIPVSIPLGFIGYFPMVFARRLPQLEVEIEAGRLQVIVDGLYQVFPDPDRYFMAFPQYLLFTLPVPTSVTSPLHLQPWDPRALGRWDTIPPRSGIFCRRRLHPGRARNMGQGQVD